MTTQYTLGRFAPSPSGRMHLGNIYAALMSWLSARKHGGKWIVRIEDLDQQRCRPEYATQLLDDLHWLGLESDGEILYQSQRTDIYTEAFLRLKNEGIVYDCFCSRADLRASSAPHASDGTPIYPGCRYTCPHVATTKTSISCSSWQHKNLFLRWQLWQSELQSCHRMRRLCDTTFRWQLCVSTCCGSRRCSIWHYRSSARMRPPAKHASANFSIQSSRLHSSQILPSATFDVYRRKTTIET